MEAERLRLRVRRAEPLAHDLGPEPPGRAEFRDLLEEVVVRVEEEREPLAELVGREPCDDGGLRVGDPVRERERKFLDSRRVCLADLISGFCVLDDIRQTLIYIREHTLSLHDGTL